ncbi:glutathione hydrolase 3 isoform X2 [Malania oleifera]|uniref:glutathione hydrolase 3 isoform X2 n=1 Tax=Malania oleifera TaxID=397392 RepID=UPI0025ADAF9C|nr:glutathione hydrolase 3 isoform X2 [Malania oleifera]
MYAKTMEAPLLEKKKKSGSRAQWLWLFIAAITVVAILGLGGNTIYWALRGDSKYHERTELKDAEIVESERGVVAADDGRCSEIGASMLRAGGHAIDAAVATALCVGVVNPVSSGIGGGSFMIVWSASTSQAQAFDMRETAPLSASENMYENNPEAKFFGPLSIGIPGELAGLYEAWLKHGRLAWRTLFQPAIKLAKGGFVVAPYLRLRMSGNKEKIMSDPGLRAVYAPNGKLLQAGDMCYNVELGRTLEAVSEQGPQAFYNGTIGEKLVRDVRDAGGILTMEDLRNYRVEVMDAMPVNLMGHTVLGMPPPSSGTLGLSLVMNILDSYGSPSAAEGSLGRHRLVEALKHMLAIRMNLGDPHFVNISEYVSDMLSPTFARQLQKKILDNTTFPPDYYMNRWSQLSDRGTSHLCIVDAERNAVSMTTTVNYAFGAGILSPSTGVLLNNEMGDFSTPTELSPDKLPPAPANFIKPNKRPLSAMTPIIVVKLIPNVVLYENWTVIDGDHIELPEESKLFLIERGHQLEARAGGATCQLVVQSLDKQKPVDMGRKNGKVSQSFHGMLTAVSDPRKDGRPAAI